MWSQDHGNMENRCFDYQVKRASAESQNQKGTLTVQLQSPVDHFHPSNRRHCYPKAELFVFSFGFLRSLHPSATVDLVTLAGSIISGSITDKERVWCISGSIVRCTCTWHPDCSTSHYNTFLLTIMTKLEFRYNKRSSMQVSLGTISQILHYDDTPGKTMGFWPGVKHKANYKQMVPVIRDSCSISHM